MSESSERLIMTVPSNSEVHRPRLFWNLHSPELPSEKVAVTGICESLTMVAQPARLLNANKLNIFLILTFLF